MQRQIERKKKKKERNSNHIIIITPLSCLFLETELQIPKYFLFVLFLSLYFNLPFGPLFLIFYQIPLILSKKLVLKIQKICLTASAFWPHFTKYEQIFLVFYSKAMLTPFSWSLKS